MENITKIKVIGIGGGGNNAVIRIIKDKKSNIIDNNSMWFNISKISFIYSSNTSIYYCWCSITKITYNHYSLF